MDPAAAAATGEWQGGLAPSVQSRVSRWSDAPPPGASDPRGHGSSALEPPFKKVRNDPLTEHDASNPPYTEGPPGLPYPASGAPAPSYGGTTGYGGTGGYVPAQSASFQSYGGGSQSQTSSGFAPGSAKANGALFYKTKLCTKFKIGACTFNERCHFAHGTEELRRPPPVGLDSMVPGPGGSTGGPPGGSFTANSGQPKKTRLCRYYAEGRCTYGDQCNFSHGTEDVPQRTPAMDFGGAGNTGAMGMGARATTASRPSYKTRLCTRWEKGEACEYGDRCHFAHGPAELQKSDGATYPNGSSVTGDMQYQYANSALPAPPAYGDPNMMNPPAYAANYGATASVGAPASGVAPNPSSYGSSGINTNPYGTSEGVNGASANYNYWNQEKTWEGAAPAYRPPSNPTQGYMQTSQPPIQASQMAPWTGGYSADGSYIKREGDTGISTYPQEPQQQLQQQPQQQLHNTAGYPRSSQDYQDPKQSINLPHVQNDGQSPYQVGARNGDGAYYNNTYNYPNQPADYTMRYNMAEAWGGKM